MTEDNNPLPKPKKGLFHWLTHLFQDEPKDREDLVELIRHSEENSLINSEIRDMLEGVMDISQLRVRDIMIPRTQMETLKLNQSFDECIAVIIKSGHSRYPVINDDKDHIEGILMVKDLFAYMHNHKDEPFSLKKIIRSEVVVPESKSVDQMLREFRSKRYHMAIIIDEFGGVSGLVTIEDILELIVGDIEDEYDDKEGPYIRAIDEQRYSVSGLTPMEEFDEVFHTQFGDEDADTLGGFIMQAFGYLPKHAESIMLSLLEFKVTAVDSRRILQLEITTPKKYPVIVLNEN